MIITYQSSINYGQGGQLKYDLEGDGIDTLRY
jgi:hypothetical protein